MFQLELKAQTVWYVLCQFDVNALTPVSILVLLPLLPLTPQLPELLVTNVYTLFQKVEERFNDVVDR